MNPSEIAQALDIAIDVRRPTFIWGPPGIGKSDLVASVAEKRGMALIDFRMALRDPTDIKGFPMPDAKSQTMKFYRDGELPVGKCKPTIVFMDELNSAPPATQASGMQLALPPYRIGDYQLPDNCCILAAGNRDGDRGVTHRMASPLANRFTHLEYEVNTDDWVHWAQDSDKVSAELVAFMRFRPNLLFTFDPKSADKAFATPRSWVAADTLRLKTKSDRIAYEMVKGTVGEGAGAEFWAFLKLIAELPSVDEIKLNPDSTKMPESPATLYALTTALGMATTDTAFARFMIYVQRMPVEFQATYVRDALRKEPKLKLDKVFTKWALKNEDVIV
jgi:MoxR-like ATPase